MIGVARRILDSILLDKSSKQLTQKVLSTFISEVCAIVNARPIVPVSSDTEFPFILTASTLLAQKPRSVAESFQHLDIKGIYIGLNGDTYRY